MIVTLQMVVTALVAAGSLAVGEAPPVPGGCSAAAAENQDQPGCYLSAEVQLVSAPPRLYWHIHEADDTASATAEARRHPWSRVILSHARNWLYVLTESGEKIDFGIHRATIGPLELPAGRPVTIRFIESVFPPGMQTRVHAHPGVEAFYVVEGEQCMETPTERIRIPAGQSFVVQSGPHVQASPKGRRNLAILAVPDGETWMTLKTDWKPSVFCGS
jgi:mannose-6-phosphate isomerase-like protein (cupin superfamily)